MTHTAPEKNETSGSFIRDVINHLEKIRRVLISVLLNLGIGFGICWVVKEHIRDILLYPIISLLPNGKADIIVTTVPEGFIAYLWMCGTGGLILTLPLLFYYGYNLAVKTYAHRATVSVVLFLSSATLFFVSGVLFAYFVIFPIGFRFFLQFSSAQIQPLLRLSDYLSFSVKLVLIFGIVFDTPVIIAFLAHIGLINADILVQNRRYAYLLLCILAAIFTPPDVITMLLLTPPLIILYEVSILLVKYISREGEPDQHENDA